MHKDYEVYKLELPGDATDEEKEAFQKTMDTIQDEMIRDQKNISETLNVSDYAAAMIQYLRSRSRWTQEKEDELIRLDQAGEKLPNVLAGEF